MKGCAMLFLQPNEGNGWLGFTCWQMAKRSSPKRTGIGGQKESKKTEKAPSADKCPEGGAASTPGSAAGLSTVAKSSNPPPAPSWQGPRCRSAMPHCTNLLPVKN